jgi:predicted GNAT family acetyltransferase
LSDAGINRESDGKTGRCGFVKDGHEAELTYSVLSSVMVLANLTSVPETLRGAGSGITPVLADARADGFRIVPPCPF